MQVDVRPTRRLRYRDAALLFTVAGAIAFLVTRPAVGDFWAAQARQSAATHGVGLTYWFSWFGGTIPGHYSVLDPIVARFLDAGWLGALSTIAITPLTYRLLRGSRHQVLATWLAAITSGFNLWSGRVPFALGTAIMLVALLCVRADRRLPAAVAGAATALASPVSGAFLMLGLCGLLFHDRKRRASAIFAGVAAGAALVFVALYFGTPGPEPFGFGAFALTTGALIGLLFARPPQYLRTVLIVSLVACPVIFLVPNGMGSNFERLTWICLPVAIAATGQARARVVVLVTAVAAGAGVIGSVQDLVVASQPMSRMAYYDGLNAELDQLPNLVDYRVEVVPDGTHVAAYALLGHAQLARGYETQSDSALNAVLESPSLDAARYKVWLDTNAVGYVAIDRLTLRSGPEDRLVRSGRLPYLREIWSDAHWRLFRVSSPTPIVAPPARIVAARQANIAVATPSGGTYALRVRWSRFLRVKGPATAQLRPNGNGWTTLTTARPGRYVIS